MAEWIAVHKKTEKEYGPYSDAQKQAIEESTYLSQSYRFKKLETKSKTKPVGEKAEGTKNEQ